MNLRRKVLNGLFWSVLEKWGGKLFSLVIFLLLARLLQPEDFGLIALAGVFVSFVQVFVAQGFAEAIIQRDELERSHLDSAFWINVGTGALMTALALVAADPVARLMGEPALVPVLLALTPLFLLAALNAVQTALLRRELAFRSLAIRTLCAGLVGGLVGVGMALRGYGVWSLVGQQLAAKVVEVALLWGMSSWRPGFRTTARHSRELFSFSMSTVGTNFLSFLTQRSDDLLIGFYLGPVALGYYAVAYRVLSTLLEVLTSVTRQVAFPLFSRLQQEPERLLRAFYSATRYTAFVAFPTFIALAAMAPEVIPLFFGPQWAPSVPVMQWLAVAGALFSVTFFNGSVLMAMGRPSWWLFAMIVSVTASLIFFMVAVRWGIVAVAAAVAIRGYLFSPISLWLIRKVLPLSYATYVRQFVPAVVGGLALGAVVVGLRAALPGLSPAAFVGLASVAGGGVYLACLQGLAPRVLQDALRLVRSVGSRSPAEVDVAAPVHEPVP